MKSISLPAFILTILLTPAIWSKDALPVVLLTSETVTTCPQLEFVDSEDKVHFVPMYGVCPGRVFSGTLEIAANNVAAGTGEFRIVPGTMLDMAGNSGTEITNGKEYLVRIDPPPTTVIYMNRYIDAQGKLRAP